MPPIVRRLIVAPAVCGPFDSDGVKHHSLALVVADAVVDSRTVGAVDAHEPKVARL
jgi:hypothetical protein